MGSKISDLFISQELEIKDLKDKTLAVDAYNMLYQFLTTIRQSDGSPFIDSKGNITSHLIGVFNRISNFISQGMNFIFVFDGVAPELKEKERERRKAIKIKAQALYEQAVSENNIDDMKKYASRVAFLTKEMVEETKLLLKAMGVSIIQAPSEGEAQAAKLVKDGLAYAVISQDADALMFETPKLIKNLNLSGKKKKSGTFGYTTIKPEIIDYKSEINRLELTPDRLKIIAILVGTDFNYGGIKGIGPKKAFKHVKAYNLEEHNMLWDDLFDELAWEKYFDFSWKEVYDTINNIKINTYESIETEKIDAEKIIEILVDNHGFNREKILSKIKTMKDSKIIKQTSLSNW